MKNYFRYVNAILLISSLIFIPFLSAKRSIRPLLSKTNIYTFANKPLRRQFVACKNTYCSQYPYGSVQLRECMMENCPDIYQQTHTSVQLNRKEVLTGTLAGIGGLGALGVIGGAAIGITVLDEKQREKALAKVINEYKIDDPRERGALVTLVKQWDAPEYSRKTLIGTQKDYSNNFWRALATLVLNDPDKADEIARQVEFTVQQWGTDNPFYNE